MCCIAHIARALCPLGTSSSSILPCGIRDRSIIVFALFHTTVILPSISRVVRCLSPYPPHCSAPPDVPLLGFGHTPLPAVGLGRATTDITSSDNTLVPPQRKEQAFSCHWALSTILTLLGLHPLPRLGINTQRQASKSLRRRDIPNVPPLGHTLLRPGNPRLGRIISMNSMVHSARECGGLAREIRRCGLVR